MGEARPSEYYALGVAIRRTFLALNVMSLSEGPGCCPAYSGDA